MRVAITGAEGLIGTVLRHGLAHSFELRALTRTPQTYDSEVVDVADLDRLAHAFRDRDAVIHLAAAAGLDAQWHDVLNSNIVGTRNVYEAARMMGVQTVVFASSGHVTGLLEERAAPALYSLQDAHVFDEQTPAAPDSLYAVSKLYGEALGRLYAENHGVRVICVRLGAVLADDNPLSDAPGRGRSAQMLLSERFPRLRAKWLSHRDCCQLFSKCVQATARYAIVYGTSNNPRQIWSLRSARELLGYEPVDAAPLSFD